MLDDVRDRLDAGGARELAQLGELLVGVGALRQDGEEEPALGLRPGPGLRAPARHLRKYARVTPVGSPPWPLSQNASRHGRSSSSTSRRRACTRPRSARTCASLVPAPFEPVYEGDEAFLWARERRARRRRSSSSPATTTPCPPRATCPGRIEDGAVHGCGASDMKGGVAVALELVRELAALASPGRVDVALLLFGREELPPQYNPLPALFDAVAARPRGRSRDPARADRPDDPGRLRRQPQRRASRSTASAATRRGPGSPTTRSTGRSRARRDRRARAPRGGRRRPPVLRGGLRHPARGGHRRQRRPRPRRRDAQLPLSAGPHAGRGAEDLVRSLVPDGRDGRDRRATRRRPTSSSTRRSSARCATPATSRVEPKQAWTNVADFTARGHRRPSTSGPARPATRTPRRARRDRRARARVPRPARRSSASVARMPALPRPPGAGDVPVRAPQRRRRRSGAAQGLEVIDFGMGDPREPTDPRILQALRDGVRERMGYPAAVGLPELREAIARWVGRRFGVALDPDAARDPDARLEGGDLLVRPGRARRRRRPRHGRRDRARLPRARSAAPRSPARASSSSRCSRRTASCPTSTRCPTTLAAHGARLAELLRTTRRAQSRRSRFSSGSRRSRASTASCSPRTRRTPSSGSTSRRPPRSSSPTGRTSSSSTRSRSARR